MEIASEIKIKGGIQIEIEMKRGMHM